MISLRNVSPRNEVLLITCLGARVLGEFSSYISDEFRSIEILNVT